MLCPVIPWSSWYMACVFWSVDLACDCDSIELEAGDCFGIVLDLKDMRVLDSRCKSAFGWCEVTDVV